MKKGILLASMLMIINLISAQTIQSSNYGTTGYIKSDGTIQNSSYSTIGYIKSDGTIQNSSYSTIGPSWGLQCHRLPQQIKKLYIYNIHINA